MAYAKKTCAKCGYQDIQPRMKQTEIEYTSGTSQKAMSTGSLVGAFLDDKSSQKQNKDSIFGTTKRKYKRTKTVWVCGNSVGCGKPAFGKVGGFFRTLKSIIRLIWIIVSRLGLLAFILYFLFLVFGG